MSNNSGTLFVGKKCKYKQFQKNGTVLQCSLDDEHDFENVKDHKFEIPITISEIELAEWCSFCLTGGQSYSGDCYECSCAWDGSLEDKLFVNCPKCFKDLTNEEIETHACHSCKLLFLYGHVKAIGISEPVKIKIHERFVL